MKSEMMAAQVVVTDVQLIAQLSRQVGYAVEARLLQLMFEHSAHPDSIRITQQIQRTEYQFVEMVRK
jgi:hypothetical protein